MEWSIVSKAADRASRESREIVVDIKSGEEIVYNLEKGRFGAIA